MKLNDENKERQEQEGRQEWQKSERQVTKDTEQEIDGNGQVQAELHFGQEVLIYYWG